MPFDLVTQWSLWFFGACAGGALLGALLGRLSRFETGIGAGLLLVGAVSLSYVPRFWIAREDFLHHPLRADATVVAIEDRAANAAGDITTPVAIVEWTARDGAPRRAASRAASGLLVGEAVVVIPDASEPGGARVGQPESMRGGMIASLLFGTFPLTAGLFFLASALFGWRERSRDADARRRELAERQRRTSRVVPFANAALFLGFLLPIAAQGFLGTSVLRTVLLAFGGVSIGVWIHVIDGLRMRRDPAWTLGMAVVAINFSVWTAALWPLSAELDAASASAPAAENDSEW